MQTATVTSSGRVLDYIIIRIIDDQGVLLNDWMVQVGMIFVPVADPDRCTVRNFKPEELQAIRRSTGGRGGGLPVPGQQQQQQVDPLAPKKLITVPDLQAIYGGILVLIELFGDPPMFDATESEEHASAKFSPRGRRHRRTTYDLAASPCEIRAPFREEEWVQFFEEEWGFLTSPPIRRNPREPDWGMLVQNAGCVLAILPPGRGFEIVCGYRIGEIASAPGEPGFPPQFKVYRYDNIGSKLVRSNSLAEVGIKLKALERFYRHAELREAKGYKPLLRQLKPPEPE